MPQMIIILFILTVATIATTTYNVQKTIAPFHGHGHSPRCSPQTDAHRQRWGLRPEVLERLPLLWRWENEMWLEGCVGSANDVGLIWTGNDISATSAEIAKSHLCGVGLVSWGLVVVDKYHDYWTCLGLAWVVTPQYTMIWYLQCQAVQNRCVHEQ